MSPRSVGPQRDPQRLSVRQALAMEHVCCFPVQRYKSSATFHFVSLLRTYVCFVTSVCIEAVWVETDLDGGNKGAPSLDNLVLLLEKGLKVIGVSDTVHDFNCLCTNTKGTCPVFH